MSNYKPKVTTIGGSTRDFTDDDLKGRPMTIADTTDVVGLSPQFAAIRQRILDAEAKGLIVPEIQLDVPADETPAETVARMERMAGFAMTPVDPAKIREIIGLPERPTFGNPANEVIGTLYRCKLTGEVFRFEGEPEDLFMRNEVRLRLERGADPVRDSECRDVGRYRFSLYYEPLPIASGEPVDESEGE